jgi:hypothetical protein
MKGTTQCRLKPHFRKAALVNARALSRPFQKDPAARPSASKNGFAFSIAEINLAIERTCRLIREPQVTPRPTMRTITSAMGLLSNRSRFQTRRKLRQNRTPDPPSLA